MYFEPPKKTYYRFPSAQSVIDLNARLYFPEKPSHIEEDTRFEARLTNHVMERETHYDL